MAKEHNMLLPVCHDVACVLLIMAYECTLLSRLLFRYNMMSTKLDITSSTVQQTINSEDSELVFKGRRLSATMGLSSEWWCMMQATETCAICETPSVLAAMNCKNFTVHADVLGPQQTL